MDLLERGQAWVRCGYPPAFSHVVIRLPQCLH